MAYTLSISRSELNAIGWHTNRGYFPEELWDHLNNALPFETDAGVQHEENVPFDVEMPERVAWSLSSLEREDPDAFLACLPPEYCDGGSEPLMDRILALLEEIV